MGCLISLPSSSPWRSANEARAVNLIGTTDNRQSTSPAPCRTRAASTTTRGTKTSHGPDIGGGDGEEEFRHGFWPGRSSLVHLDRRRLPSPCLKVSWPVLDAASKEGGLQIDELRPYRGHDPVCSSQCRSRARGPAGCRRPDWRGRRTRTITLRSHALGNGGTGVVGLHRLASPVAVALYWVLQVEEASGWLDSFSSQALKAASFRWVIFLLPNPRVPQCLRATLFRQSQKLCRFKLNYKTCVSVP